MVAHAAITFETEARDIASDEHFTLSRRFEEIAQEHGEAEARRQLADHGYSEDFETFYKTHRLSFLEEARELCAERV